MIVHNLELETSVLDHFIAEIRDIEIQKDAMRFRRNIERIGEVLSYEMSKTLNYKDQFVTTPLGEKSVPAISDKMVLCSILRAGLPLHQGILNYFDDIDKETLLLFAQTKEAFLKGDEEKGRSACRRGMIKRCDKVLEELARGDLSVNEAVCYALIARYFKRIIAHLVNIATSVVLPLSDLDYCDEERCLE